MGHREDHILAGAAAPDRDDRHRRFLQSMMGRARRRTTDRAGGAAATLMPLLPRLRAAVSAGPGRSAGFAWLAAALPFPAPSPPRSASRRRGRWPDSSRQASNIIGGQPRPCRHRRGRASAACGISCQARTRSGQGDCLALPRRPRRSGGEGLRGLPPGAEGILRRWQNGLRHHHRARFWSAPAWDSCSTDPAPARPPSASRRTAAGRLRCRCGCIALRQLAELQPLQAVSWVSCASGSAISGWPEQVHQPLLVRAHHHAPAPS